MQNNNPLVTEIGLLVLSVAILAAMTVLLVVGKINYIEALNFLIVVAGLFGVNVAAKAPSPAQQAQLQQITSQALSALPAVVAATQQPTLPQGGSVIAPPVVAPSPIDPGVSMAAYSTSQLPIVTPPVQP